MGVFNRLAHGWNALKDEGGGPEQNVYRDYGASYSSRPDRLRPRILNDKSIVSSIYNRVGIDAAAVPIRHVIVDQNGRFKGNVTSGLNNCLTLEANIDQAARAFIQDAVMTLFDKGVIAIVPVDTDIDPTNSNAYDIKTMRVGEIVGWFPKHVRVSLYNEATGQREEITLPKAMVAVVENPLYTVMNEPNSTLQRLIRKLSLLDSIDEQSGSGKLDMIIQLPYVIKSEARKQQAEQRRSDIEVQLKGSKYGVAYTDGTEKITQLNRPVENNMLKQIEYLQAMLYGQLGITEDVFNGTADEKTMLNYHNRTIEPVLSALTLAMKRTFLSKTARTRGHSIEFFRDPFKLVSIAEIAEIADKFTRNEIMSSNDIRAVMGLMPSDAPGADELRNKNMPATDGAIVPSAAPTAAPDTSEEDAIMEHMFSSLESNIDKIISDSEEE